LNPKRDLLTLAERSLAEDELEIQKLLAQRAKVEDMIPAEINLGLYVVRTKRPMKVFCRSRSRRRAGAG
jgi:hypothetical protein